MMGKSTSAAETRFLASGNTNVGRVRKSNEDVFYCDDERGIFIVVDGMGGHNAGEVAARIAVDTVKQVLCESIDCAEERLRRAIIKANNEIYARSESNPDWQGMQCVLTAAVIEGDMLTIGHVGDTRLCKIRGGEIRKVTRDHSPVGILEELDQISEIEAMRLPNRNEVLKSLGSEIRAENDQGFADIDREEIQVGDAILLCSDGLSDLLTSERIRRVIEEHNGYPAAIVNSLIEAANEEGGKDNITVVYAQRISNDSKKRGMAGLADWALALPIGFLLGVAVVSYIRGGFIGRNEKTEGNKPLPAEVIVKPSAPAAVSSSKLPDQISPAQQNGGEQQPLNSGEEIATYTKTLDLQKKTIAQTFYLRSQAYRSRGQREQARQDCRQAKRFDPSLVCGQQSVSTNR